MPSLPISVVIPTYNGRRFIADAIGSVLQQTLRPAEIVVVDDCSTDDTLEVIERLKENATIPIAVHRLAVNSGGPARPINFGVSAASSAWIAVLEQDDVFFANSLQSRASALERVPQLDVVAGRAVLLKHEVGGDWSTIVSTQGKLRDWPKVILQRFENAAAPDSNSDGLVVLEPGCHELFVEHGMFLNGFPSMLFRKSAWEQLKGIDETLRITGDFDFSCRLAEQFHVGLISTTVYCQRAHDANLTKRKVAMLTEDMIVRAACLVRNPGDPMGKNSTTGCREDSAAFRSVVSEAYGRYHWFRSAGEYRSAEKALRVLHSLNEPMWKLLRLRMFLTLHKWLVQWGLLRTRDNSLTRP